MTPAAAAGFVLAFAAAAIASSLYPGSGAVFLFFNACFFALVGLALPRPRLYVYTFAAAFLALGFWLKVVVHAIAVPGFVEPVGDFSYTAGEWDRALRVAACAALGLIAARLGHLAWAARFPACTAAGPAEPPAWFVRWRKSLWLLTLVLIVAVHAANLRFAFYQVGVKPKLLLPFHGHVLVAWLVNVGFALWVAALAWWDYRHGKALGRGLLAATGEAFLSAVSAFSRMTFLLHTVPYALVMVERREELLRAMKRRSLYMLASVFLALFVLGVLAVFWLRVYHYYGYAADAPGNEPIAGHVERTIRKQLPLLLVHRWVGLEGVLAVGAAERSPRRLADAVLESPSLGENALFQRAAKPAYLSENPAQFTFLANAGPVALLWFSGSLAIVLVGMAGIAAVLFATEEAARRWTGNPFLLAVAGAALANVVSQTTVFYLTLIFLLQLWLALLVVGALQRLKLGDGLKKWK